MILRPYQQSMLDKAVAALSAHGNTLAVAPTGAGKSVILSATAAKIGGKQCILQHRDELTTQNMRKYLLVNGKRRVGLYNADVKSWNSDVTFAMAQTLSRPQGLASIPKLDLLVIDEAHHAVAPSYRKIVEAARDRNPDCLVFGVTATPARGDKKGLRHIFSNCCDQISLHSLIRMGFLVRPRTFVCTLEGTGEQLARVRKTASGEFDMDEAAKVLNVDIHNEAVVRKWKELAGDRKTIVFASNVDHARDVTEAFKAAGVNAALLTGETTTWERADLLRRFDKGPVQVLVNVAVLTEGYDSQPVSCVVLLRPCSYKSTMIQMIGRGLRTVDPAEYPGVVKTDCLVLDFGNSLNTHRDLESKVMLDGREKGPAPEKICPKCEATVPLAVRECPICGYEWEDYTPESEDEQREKVSDIAMEEIDIIDSSPFRWCDLFGSGKVMMASGFEAWCAVASRDGEQWTAVGKLKEEKICRRLMLGERVPCLAAADDFLRMNESDDAAKKNRRWLNDSVTDKQWSHLQRLGFGQDMMLTFTKYSAACTLNFFWNRHIIEKEVLNG
ncbi:DEAD/DEAH box helicase [uncultured Desulfovibrio sp.]|uniref:DEAD/DEAH box helicase n=1 Tax=uncultured Desulfovibrio sp. TaxID=167968 RepID=UPI00205578C1|nr:DEAD/DEAH box helicase [uncultured Desulfovibrio sp.]DAV75453.1 MAG TPA: Chromatin remodeling complex ATPase [Caudoviricetes sp.]